MDQHIEANCHFPRKSGFLEDSLVIYRIPRPIQRYSQKTSWKEPASHYKFQGGYGRFLDTILKGTIKGLSNFLFFFSFIDLYQSQVFSGCSCSFLYDVFFSLLNKFSLEKVNVPCEGIEFYTAYIQNSETRNKNPLDK